LSAVRWSSVSETRAAAGDALAVSLAHISHHVRAALIKLRGDPAWRDLTALYYHFETQPIPNPLSRFFHFFSALGCSSWAVLFNHFAELDRPVVCILSAHWPAHRRVIMIAFQVTLIAGRQPFLPELADDRSLRSPVSTTAFGRRLLPRALANRATTAAVAAQESRPMRGAAWTVRGDCRRIERFGRVTNMLSPRQIMNTSFDPLDLVNTYGAFRQRGARAV